MKTILIFVDWFFPGYKGGGPIKSVLGLVQALDSEVSIDIFTRDRDFKCRKRYPGISPGEWTLFESNVRVCYLTPGHNIFVIKNLVAGKVYDSIYVNSLFSFNFSIKPRLLYLIGFLKARRFIIAPRGEVKPAALNWKPKKKKLFLYLAKTFRLYRRVTWHATSREEVAYIKNIWGDSSNIFMASNLPPLNVKSGASLRSKELGKLKLIFVSRVIGYKNLLFVLQVLKEFGLKENESISLDIYGPIEDSAYWDACKDVINSMQSKQKIIRYQGELFGDQVVDTFSKYDLFFFPTLGENFGHVIAEAMASGTPVLISDTTPWSQVEEEGAGWIVNLQDKNRFMEVISKLLPMEEGEFMKYRVAAVSLFARVSRDPKVIQEYVNNF